MKLSYLLSTYIVLATLHWILSYMDHFLTWIGLKRGFTEHGIMMRFLFRNEPAGLVIRGIGTWFINNVVVRDAITKLGPTAVYLLWIPVVAFSLVNIHHLWLLFIKKLPKKPASRPGFCWIWQ